MKIFISRQTKPVNDREFLFEVLFRRVYAYLQIFRQIDVSSAEHEHDLGASVHFLKIAYVFGQVLLLSLRTVGWRKETTVRLEHSAGD